MAFSLLSPDPCSWPRATASATLTGRLTHTRPGSVLVCWVAHQLQLFLRLGQVWGGGHAMGL